MQPGRYITMKEIANASWRIILKKPLELEFDYKRGEVGLHYAPFGISVFGADEQQAENAFKTAFLDLYNALVEGGQPVIRGRKQQLTMRMFGLIREVDFL